MRDLSVQALWHELLPTGTRLLGGTAGLERSISWPIVLRAHAPAFDAPRGGELAIVPVERLSLVDPSLTLARVVAELARTRISAVCAIGAVDDDAVAAANAAPLPLFHLPDGTNPHDAQATISRKLTEHHLGVARRIGEIGHELSALALADAEDDAIVRRAAQASDAIVMRFDANGALVAMHVPATVELSRDALTRLVAQLGAHLENGATTGSAAARLDDGRTATIAPIRSRAGGAGNVALITTNASPTELERAVLEHTAVAYQIQAARHEAVVAARDDLLSDFIAALCEGRLESPDVFERRGRGLGYDLAQPHLVLAVDGDPGDVTSIVDATRHVSALGKPVLATHLGDAILMLVPIEAEQARPDVPLDPVRLASDLQNRLRQPVDLGWSAPSIGVGGIAAGAAAIAAAIVQARQARLVGNRLRSPGHVTSSDELQLHQMLASLVELPTVRAFHRRMLGPLIDHDFRTGAELLRTLDAYLACGCSPTTTAESLNLHRNGVLYRLQRIREIVPLDLDDPEQRLCLHVALRIGDVLEGGEERQLRNRPPSAASA